jgi:hypothetical protein
MKMYCLGISLSASILIFILFALIARTCLLTTFAAQDILTGYWSTYGFVGIAFVGGLTTILYRYLTLQSGKKLKTE